MTPKDSPAREWTLDYPAATPPLSSNRRVHWRRKHQEQSWWSSATAMLVRQAHVPHLDRCELTVYVTPPDRKRRDSDNLIAHLLKPIKDGLVHAGVIDDDTDRYIVWRLELTPPEPNPMRAWRYRAVVRELEPAEVVQIMDFSDFDRFCEEHNIIDDELPAAFAAWLNERTGWDGPMDEVVP